MRERDNMNQMTLTGMSTPVLGVYMFIEAAKMYVAFLSFNMHITDNH